jgi:hypothetical protein
MADTRDGKRQSARLAVSIPDASAGALHGTRGPALLLVPAARARGDSKAVRAILERGLNDSAHTAFVAPLGQSAKAYTLLASHCAA